MKGDQPGCPSVGATWPPTRTCASAAGSSGTCGQVRAGPLHAQCNSSSRLLSIGPAIPSRDDIRDRRLALAEPRGPSASSERQRPLEECLRRGRAAHTGQRRILVSGGERSGGRSPEAGRDSRNVPGCGGSFYGAGRVGDLAAAGIAAWPGLPRHRVPPGRLPRFAPGARHARAGGRAGEQRRSRAGSCRPSWGRVPLVLLVAGLAAYALTQLVEAVFRSARATGAIGRWRQRAMSSWGFLVYSAFA